jgi:lipoate-protein ligase B
MLPCHDFGLTDYATIWDEQKRRVADRVAGTGEDVVLIGQHPHVITLGRGTHAENLLAPGVPVVEIERGGDVTYHGPGQLIAYPILLMPKTHRDLHRYLRLLEEAIIRTVGSFGVTGHRNPGWTGVWVTEPATGTPRKIASIGVAVKQWVTYHGIALNVTTDLSYFNQINPCGLESAVMTNLDQLTDPCPSMETVKQAFCRSLSDVLTEDGWPIP